MALVSGFGDRLESTMKMFQPVFDRLRYSGNEGDHSPPTRFCGLHQPSQLHGKRIAFVFQVEFESLGRKDGCASRRPAIPSCKRQGGVLEQENSADLPLDVTGDPKTFLVAADEKCRDRVVDDAGIERLKLCDDGRTLVGWQDAETFAFPLSCSGRAFRQLLPRNVWVCQLHDVHRVLTDALPCRCRTCSASDAASRIR